MNSPPASDSASPKTPPDPSTHAPASLGETKHLIYGRPPGKRRKWQKAYSLGMAHDKTVFRALQQKWALTGDKRYMTTARTLNPLVAHSKRDALGRIDKLALTGCKDNTARPIASKFEDIAGSKEQIAEHLEALGEKLPKRMYKLVEALRAPENEGRSFALVLAGPAEAAGRIDLLQGSAEAFALQECNLLLLAGDDGI